jgi:hypothetical protein
LIWKCPHVVFIACNFTICQHKNLLHQIKNCCVHRLYMCRKWICSNLIDYLLLICLGWVENIYTFWCFFLYWNVLVHIIWC